MEAPSSASILPPAPDAGPIRRGFGFAIAALVLGATVHLVSAGWHVLFGALNPDEGFYAVATRAVAEGEMPYRDFGFTQPPLTPYLNSLPLRLTGYGLFAQRIVNGLWAAAALALAAGWVARRTRPSWGLVLALGFSLSAPWMYFVHLGKTYGLTTLLVTLTAWVFLALAVGPRRNFLVGLLGALCVATRLPAAPFAGVLWIACLWPGRPPTGREVLGALGGVAAGLGAAIVPFAVAAPDNAWYWVFEFHRISVPNKQWHLAWQEIATLAPAVWIIAAVGAGVAARRRRLPGRTGAVFLAATVALGANLLPGGVYEEYGVPFLLPLAGCAALWLHEGRPDLPALPAAALVALLAIAQFGTAPLVLRDDFPERRGTPSALLTPNAPPYNPALPAQLAAARELVDLTVPVDAPLIGTNLILAAETGRAVPPELRMGPFAFTAELPDAVAARRHFATRVQLDRWFASPATRAMAFFRRPDLNFGWSLPSFDPPPEPVRQHWRERFRRDYSVALTEGPFVILVRHPPATSPP